MGHLSQPFSIFNMDSLLSSEAKWQVKFSDSFLESMARFTDSEIHREVGSLVTKLSTGWRQPHICRNTEMDIEKTHPLFGQFANFGICKTLGSLLDTISSIWSQPQKVENAKANLEVTWSLLEKYNAIRDLCLIWAVDIVVQDNILPANKIEELEKMLMDKVYVNYTEYMISRCKEKHVDGNLMLPITWPIDSDTDPSWSLVKQLSTLSLRNQPASASRVSSVREFGNRKSNRYVDSRYHGREAGGKRKLFS